MPWTGVSLTRRPNGYFTCDLLTQFACLFCAGITGLAHPSPVSLGETHGVYVLEPATDPGSLLRRCKQFLHKPSISTMRATSGCVQRSSSEMGSNEFIISDSAFFMAPDACLKLLDFYNQHNPLTCEVDAYGDFLQVP